MISSSALQKVKSLVTLVAFSYSLFTPLFNIAFAVSPTVNLTYSANPAGAGLMTVTATYSESIVGTPLISIDQPGTTDIVDATMLDLGTGSSWSYDYNVNAQDGSGYIDGTANVTLTGAYNGSGEIADPASNASFDIVTLDATPPVVTLSGSTPEVVFSGGVFFDEGATWMDNVDGTGTISAYNSGTLDVNNSGSYLIGYVYVDGAGNTGSVDRVVNVIDSDTTAPVVTLSGSTPMNVEYSGSFVDPGATWTDNIDGAGTIGAYNSGTLDINTLGTYTIGYVYIDAAGNTGSAERTVNVVDMTAPVLTLSGFSPELLLSGGVFFDEGANWTDNIDGSGVIANYNSGTLDVNNTGAYLISYVYVDAAGNTGSVDRIVLVDEPDTTPPVVSLSGSSPVIIFSGGVFVDEGATWIDNWDGSGVIANYNSGTLDVNNTGSYLVSYVYVDMAGNTGSVDRVVNVVIPDFIAPIITLNDISPIETEIGEPFVDFGATWTDNVDGTGTISAYNSGYINTGALGTYTIAYIYTDAAGNTGSTELVVNVIDSTRPVVTLSGSNPVIIFTGGTFLDEGANWTDNVDGSGVISAYNSGMLDVNNSGTYHIGYFYVDSSGNTGSIDRMVQVVEPDYISPNITLIGYHNVNTELGGAYGDLGASWTDNVDGTGFTLVGSYSDTGSFAYSGFVDTNTIGNYQIEYLKVDSSGNQKKMFRTVNVVDTTTPTAIIEQKLGQPDPTYTGSALYVVTFSEPINVSTFTSGALSFSGSSASGLTINSINEIAPFDGTTFEVEVTAVSTGSIVLSIPGTSHYFTTSTDLSNGIAIDGSGNIYTADYYNDTVSKITPDGVSNILGSGGSRPLNIVVDNSGNVFTLSDSDSTITKITPGGFSSVFGNPGFGAMGLVIDNSGNLYTAKSFDDTVIKFTSTGASSTLGTTGDHPSNLTIDGSGNVFTINSADNTVTKITSDGVSSLFGTASIDSSLDLTVDDSGNIYTLHYLRGIIGKITTLGVSSILGTTDLNPYSIITDNSGNIYVLANLTQATITKITPSGVSTIIGKADDAGGGIVMDGSGNFFIDSLYTNIITKVTPGGIEDLHGNLIATASVSSDNSVSIIEIDSTAPNITLVGISPIDVEFGTIYNDSGATWTDNLDGSGSTLIGSYGSTGSFASSGTVDTNTLGIYSIEYKKVDTTGNSGSVIRTVNVVDTTAPVVTLSGSTPETILSGSVFTDEGATWSDTVDGTGVIPNYNSGTLDINNTGSYLIGYVYTDAAGNTGSVDRVVNVVEPDVTAPVLSLSGSSPIDVEFGGPYIDDGATWTDNVDGTGTISGYNSGSINTGSLGVYVVSYVYVDLAGNTGSVDRMVNVVDTTAPVVTLSGSSPVTILSGSVFTDEGAIWSDAVDGIGVISNYNSGTLDINNIGSYLIGYVYVDGAGNTGSVDRVVNVVEPDVTAPVVTLSGSSPIDVEFGGPYLDDGATWTDNVDGSGTISAYNSGSIDVEALGPHIITYVYVDMAGNTGSVDRVVNIVDTTAPIVTLSGSSPVTIFTGGVFIDEGATWSDVVDGGGTIVSYNSGILDVNNTGSYLIGYVYVDGAGNTGSVDRIVNVVEPDVTAPVVTLSGSSPIDVEYAGSFVDDGATWTDNVDGSGTISTFNSGTLDVNTIGTYLIGYVYVDAAGNTGSVDRVVNVVDITAPVLSLSGVNPVNIFSGGIFMDEGATWSDAVDGTGVVASYNSGTLDVNNTGSYQISYVYVDSSGNTGSVDRVVNVMDPDTAPPTVTLYGISPIDIEFGSIYTDLGAEWSDNFDGTGNTLVGTYGNSGSFAMSGSVDTNTLGAYPVEYYKVDISGNAGSAIRTVNIVDTTAPVVTLSGSSPVTILSGSVFTDEGAIWSDAVDGTGVIMSATSGSVDVNTLGTYVVDYSYTDISGNTGSTSRIVNVVAAPDIVPPVVTLIGSTLVNVEYGSSFIDLGATWTDNVDGSGTISAYTSGSVNTGALGTYTISYEYVDGAGNTGSTNRSVIVRDTVVPTASITYSNLLTTSGSVIATLTGSSEAITIVNNAGSPNYTFMANGSFTYTYIDASGNTGTTMATVNNIDTTAPVISIVGGSSVTVALGSTYIDQGATANDNISGNLTAFIVASGSVNTSLTGTYIVEYSVSDSAGNRSTVNRTVNISPVVSAPAVYNIGGGGGGSAGSYVSYFSAPTNAFELSSDNQQSSSNSQSMTLGIANLQRLLNLSLSQEQHSETSDVRIPSSSESTPQAFEPITEDIDGRVGETEIIYLIQRGIINNSSNFNPDRTMTRGEFIKIVSGFYESSSETSLELPFADIESDEMRKYIEIAYSYGLITRQNLFRPNDPITTGEAKTILMRSEGTSGEGNLFLSEKNTITRENGAIIIVSWLADRS